MTSAFYSVYRKPDYTPVIIYKNRIQCAAAMGVTPASFDSIASRIRHGYKHKKWDIVRYEEDETEVALEWRSI